MSASETQAGTDAQAIVERLARMGIEARLMPGGRCAVAVMRFGTEPLDTPAGPLAVSQVTFSTVGADRIKCLRPRALFQLPILRILDCRDATAIEARIRLAWQRHVAELRLAAQWLRRIGADPRPEEDGSVLAFPLAGESQSARVRVIDRSRAVLPTPGPLSGIALQRPEDRLIRIDRSAGTSVELEIAVTNRMEELARLDQRLAEESRREVILEDLPLEKPRRKSDTHRLLLVGPRLSEERICIESLKLRGYEVLTARTQQEAVAALDRWSPELVMVDTNLGRFEGIELIPELRQVAGIEEVPVVLVDDHRRPARREAARSVGAAGYLVRPIDVPRIAARLAKLVSEPRRRRFRRYESQVSARVNGAQAPCIATDLGRGGMFLATDEDLPAHSLRDCELRLPELGRTLRVRAEVLYRMGAAGARRRGVGMRFRHFPDANEPLLIEYLRSLDAPPAATA